ncbi:MAG: hypothetical protein R2762_07695 [Bryobacteraceae bacterium]
MKYPYWPVILMLASPAWAQTQEAKAEPAQEKTEAPAEAAEQASEEESPQPVTEKAVWSAEFGYRFRGDVHGDFSAYRSVVNLGEGPKLFHFNLILPSSGKLFDRLELRGDSWGGEPYNTSSLFMERRGLYRLDVRYRNLAYFNQLPSYSLNRQSSDLRRRGNDAEFTLFPGRGITPFFAWSVDSGTGAGISHFVADINEYAVAGTLADRTDLFRGGIRVERSRWHLTLEQGGTRFHQDDSFSDARAGSNPGNRSTPFLGETLRLDQLSQTYRVRGNTIYSKGLITASPAHWVDFTGQFLYSRPSVDSTYNADALGRFVSRNALVFANALRGMTFVEAKQPRTSGSASVELRPFERLRLVETWMTDRLHNASGIVGAETLPVPLDLITGDRLTWNWSSQQLDGFFDVAPWLTVRGGHRYLWGDASTRAPNLTGPNTAELKRHTGLLGVVARPATKLRFQADYEAAKGDGAQAWFRTSLNDYQKLRSQIRYQPLTTLTLHANVQALENRNPSPLGGYDFLSRSTSIGVLWAPERLKGVVASGSYARSTLRSDISYLEPQVLQPQRSFYRENAHGVTGLMEWNGAHLGLAAGGSAFVSSGSRPTRLYQPVGRVVAPLRPGVSAKAEWRWHGLTEPFFALEGFRTHLFVFSLVVGGK